MGGGYGVLGGSEDFFVEFLAGAEACVFDFDVAVGDETCELDHSAGEVVDLHGLAHIEDADFVGSGESLGFHHEAASFGDSHKVAYDTLIGDCDGAAIFDLLAEMGDHGTVGPEDVAKAGGDEAGAALYLAGGYGAAEALDVDFSEALCAAHYVGGIHGFVCGDHYHLLHVVLDAFVGNVAGAEDVHEDGLAGVLFH